VDRDELDLLGGALRKAMSDATGDALYAELTALGWHDMCRESPHDAVPLVCRLLGETGGHAPVLDDIVAGPGLRPARLPYTGGHQVRWRRQSDPQAGCVLDPDLPLTVLDGATDFQDALSAGQLAAGRIAVGWWLLGTGHALLALALTHVVDRTQFGRPLASFQALRHRLAETRVALDGAEAALAHARAGGDTGALLAKAAAGSAALTAARHCQQALGGLGFTSEHALHRHVKRALVLDGLFGSTRELTAEAGRLLLADGTAPRLTTL
jgi:hypothetical protein